MSVAGGMPLTDAMIEGAAGSVALLILINTARRPV